jgi:hypothetical protein
MPLGQYQGIPRADPGGRVTLVKLIHGLDCTKAMPTFVPAAADLTPVSCLRVRQPSMATNPLSTLLQRFACARLSQ